MKKKAIICGLAALLLATGCGKVPKLENGQDKVISLGEKEGISADELYTELKEEYGLNALINMVDEKILNDKYKSSDEEKAYISSMKEQIKMYYDYLYSSSYATYEAFLQSQYGVNNESELDPILSLDYKRNKAIEDYSKTLVTDKEVQNYYDNKTVGNIEASHILITADYADDATEEEKKAAEDKALETAKEVIKKLDAGEKFADLAKTYSKDGSASNGGALGEFNEGEMVDEFWDACVSLKVNEYTKTPVKTQYGYHIILKTAEHEKAPLEQVKDKIISKLAGEKRNADSYFSYKALIKIREENGMTIEDSSLKTQYENYVYNVENHVN